MPPNAPRTQVLSILHARELHVAKMQILLQERATIARQAAELTQAACSTSPAGMGAEEVSNMWVLGPGGGGMGALGFLGARILGQGFVGPRVHESGF